MLYMENIDFSRFSQEVLESIELAAKIADSFNSNIVMPCHLVGGLASINGEEICDILQQKGYDSHATMDAIGHGMSDIPFVSGVDGVTFHPDIVDFFISLTSTTSNASISKVMQELLSSSHIIDSYLIKNENIGCSSSIQGGNYNEESPTGDTIRQYCVDMLELAANGKIHRAIGREEEVNRVLLILARSSKNNPVLVGAPGTGKTAIAEELAVRLQKGEVPSDLVNLKLFSLDFSSIKSLPDSVDVMKNILKEATNDPQLVLFIDEIHMLISSSSYSDNDIANLLKPAMARGDVKIFGATTLDEYRRIEKDPAFERRFQKIIVDEPDIDSAIKIIEGSKSKFEIYHNISIPNDVCKAAVNLSARYITNRKLPDKAIDLIDEAAATLRIQDGNRRTLEVNDIMKVVTDWTGIPIDNMDADETQRLLNIEEELHKSVVGQDKAIKTVSDAIKRSRMGFGDASRPIGSFLFLGTTGTGKTELCKAIAKFLFNNPNQMVRIDMSEYQQEHSAHRLFGAPPGYVGYEQGGQLTEAVYRKPFSVVLFDEIEKAHPKIFETLLQVLDDGRMTDGQGKVVNFKNTIIVMTSNMGQQNILNTLCGRDFNNSDIEQCTQNVMQQLRMIVAPEFINRIDNIVMFLPLTKKDIGQIAEINLKKEQKRLKEEKGITTIIEPSAVDFIVEHGYQPRYGGRPVKRAIVDYIINPLISELLNGTINKNLPIYILENNNKIFFKNVITPRI